MPTFQNKQKSRKSTFKAFGDFIALHMVKKLVRKNKNERTHITTDALEAGFSQDDSKLANGHSNGHSNGRNVNRSSSMNATSNYSVKQNSVSKSVDLNALSSIPGVFGLVNHGNTCFINSIIQCLSNTDIMAEYFVMGQYKTHLKSCRKDRSKKYGTKGELTEQVATVIKSLWTGSYSSEMTKNLKEVISKHGVQYKGNVQHDSQEFLLWLFDKIHEDLNLAQVVKKNPFTRQKSFRKSTKKIALERNKIIDLTPNSVVQKTFQGQYHSSLTCPNCKKKSETGDPFLCVSLPLKQKTNRAIFVNVSYLPSKRKSGRKNFAGKTIKIGVEVPINGKINQLRQEVSFECGIHSRLLAFVDLKHDGFHESYGDEKNIDSIPVLNVTNQSLYAFEMPPVSKLTAGTLPRNYGAKQKKRVTLGGKTEDKVMDSIVVILINKQGIGEQGKRFGSPLVFRTSRDVSLSELQSLVLSQMNEFIKDGVKHEKLGSLFRLQIHDGLPSKNYLSSPLTPLRLPTVDKALENCPAGGPLHIKLMAEWDTETKSGLFDKFPDEKIEVQESVRLQRLLNQQPITCTLEDCFDLHTMEEILAGDNCWNCPFCHTGQHGAVKKLSFSTLPDILVLHLKRFKVTNEKRTKLSTRVDFPITGLDMNKHIYKPESNGHHNSFHQIKEPCLYDLYAICNHYGNLNSGHYTACCSNPLNGKWYLFDDTTTECIAEKDLSSQSVYILFYQKRTNHQALSCTSVNSVMSDHWSLQLPQFKQQIQFNSLSHLNNLAVHQRGQTINSKPPEVTLQHNINNNANKIAQQIKITQLKSDKKIKEVDKKEVKKEKSQSFKDPKSPDWGSKGEKQETAQSPKSPNWEIPKSTQSRYVDPPKRANFPEPKDNDDGGFDDPRRPFVRGLHHQGSASMRGRDPKGQELRGRQYKSYRHNDRRKRQQSSHV